MKLQANEIEDLIVRGRSLVERAQSLLQQMRSIDEESLAKAIARLTPHALEQWQMWLQDMDSGRSGHHTSIIEPGLAFTLQATLLCKSRA